jgi:hypothetical protein
MALEPQEIFQKIKPLVDSYNFVGFDRSKSTIYVAMDARIKLDRRHSKENTNRTVHGPGPEPDGSRYQHTNGSRPTLEPREKREQKDLNNTKSYHSLPRSLLEGAIGDDLRSAFLLANDVVASPAQLAVGNEMGPILRMLRIIHILPQDLNCFRLGLGEIRANHSVQLLLQRSNLLSALLSELFLSGKSRTSALARLEGLVAALGEPGKTNGDIAHVLLQDEGDVGD